MDDVQPTPEKSEAVASGFILLHLDLKLKSAVVRGLAEPPPGGSPLPRWTSLPTCISPARYTGGFPGGSRTRHSRGALSPPPAGAVIGFF